MYYLKIIADAYAKKIWDAKTVFLLLLDGYIKNVPSKWNIFSSARVHLPFVKKLLAKFTSPKDLKLETKESPGCSIFSFIQEINLFAESNSLHEDPDFCALLRAFFTEHSYDEFLNPLVKAVVQDQQEGLIAKNLENLVKDFERFAAAFKTNLTCRNKANELANLLPESKSRELTKFLGQNISGYRLGNEMLTLLMKICNCRYFLKENLRQALIKELFKIMPYLSFYDHRDMTVEPLERKSFQFVENFAYLIGSLKDTRERQRYLQNIFGDFVRELHRHQKEAGAVVKAGSEVAEHPELFTLLMLLACSYSDLSKDQQATSGIELLKLASERSLLSANYIFFAGFKVFPFLSLDFKKHLLEEFVVTYASKKFGLVDRLFDPQCEILRLCLLDMPPNSCAELIALCFAKSVTDPYVIFQAMGKNFQFLNLDMQANFLNMMREFFENYLKGISRGPTLRFKAACEGFILAFPFLDESQKTFFLQNLLQVFQKFSPDYNEDYIHSGIIKALKEIYKNSPDNAKEKILIKGFFDEFWKFYKGTESFWAWSHCFEFLSEKDKQYVFEKSNSLKHFLRCSKQSNQMWIDLFAVASPVWKKNIMEHFLAYVASNNVNDIDWGMGMRLFDQLIQSVGKINYEDRVFLTGKLQISLMTMIAHLKKGGLSECREAGSLRALQKIQELISACKEANNKDVVELVRSRDKPACVPS